MSGDHPIALDVDFVRSHFPAFGVASNAGQSFLENAGGSYACRQTIDALHGYYTENRVQPYAGFAASAAAGRRMDLSRAVWADALGVDVDEVVFGPSTSANTYVLAHAFGELLDRGDEVVVTSQDHEANTGVFRRAAERARAEVREWRIDPQTGLLDLDELRALVGARTRLVTVPHASNLVGQENDVAAVAEIVHRVGGHLVVDGVSYAPHSFPDVDALGADVYLFSLYKTYSVHQGLMVVRRGLLDELPNQGHYFNADHPDKRLNPAGPDHAQVAAAGAVLDYVRELHVHHGGAPTDDVRTACASVSSLWRRREHVLASRLLDALSVREDVRIVGPTTVGPVRHRCPTVAFSPCAIEPATFAAALVERGVQTSSGSYYAPRVLEGLGLDPGRGVVRLSALHYTSDADIDRVLAALEEIR